MMPSPRRRWPASIVAVLGWAALAPALRAQAPAADVDPRVARLLEAISEERLAATLRRLASFGTRHTLSSDAPGRGVGAAREWMLEDESLVAAYVNPPRRDEPVRTRESGPAPTGP